MLMACIFLSNNGIAATTWKIEVEAQTDHIRERNLR